MKQGKKIIYLDFAAATPLDLEVKKAMEPFWNKNFGNPSALYSLGIDAKKAIEQAREKIAHIINSRPQEVIFTAGGTESINLAIFGVAKNFQPVGKKKYHFITTKIEHSAVLRSFGELTKRGFQTTLVKVNKQGIVNLEELFKSVREETVFISVMYANNEIGSIQPIAKISKWLKAENVKRGKKKLPKIIFHTDACQAAEYLDLNVNRLGIDLMSLNGSKIYGPKQTGILYKKSGVNLKPIIFGGNQERGLRSGTENVPGIVGLAKALELSQKNRNNECKRLNKLKDYFIRQLKANIPNIFLNGPTENRLPNNINITISEVEGEALVLYLDSLGICASTGSACETGGDEPSHVLKAIGLTSSQAKSSVRFTMGRHTTKSDIDNTVDALSQLVKKFREKKINTF